MELMQHSNRVASVESTPMPTTQIILYGSSMIHIYVFMLEYCIHQCLIIKKKNVFVVLIVEICVELKSI